jgi:superfamily II DNA helicase RecQ
VIPLEEERNRWLLLAASLRDLGAGESCLIYCSSHRECDQVTAWLRCIGVDAVAYHAGLPREERRTRSLAFRNGLLRVVCATSAFGMGIDYPSVRRVIHFSLPYDLESYWQEVGRAGRDDEPSFALAFWRRSELARVRRLDAEQSQRYFQLWQAWIDGECRVRSVASQLGFVEKDCGKCDRCLQKTGSSFPVCLEGWRDFLRGDVWWLRATAEPKAWLERNFSAHRKALDALANPDSVSDAPAKVLGGENE